MGKQKLDKNGKEKFCIYSGKPIRNKEVILSCYAKEFVIKTEGAYDLKKLTEEEMVRIIRDKYHRTVLNIRII